MTILSQWLGSTRYLCLVAVPMYNLCSENVMWSNKLSRNSQLSIVRFSQRKQVTSLFPIVFATLQLPVSLDHLTNFNVVCFKRYLCKRWIQSVRKMKSNLNNFRLILHDHITYKVLASFDLLNSWHFVTGASSNSPRFLHSNYTQQ